MIHIALVGAGAVAATHVDAFLQSSDLCCITAICNRHIEKAKVLIQNKSLSEARAFSSLECALKEREDNALRIDAVAICTAPGLHAKEAILAMEHGLHVLVEKPMANSLEECDAMIQASQKNNVLLSVICQLRFTTAVQRVKHLLQTKQFGSLHYAVVDSLWWRGEHYHDPAWRGTWEKEGGGVLTSQALHHLDLLQYLIGRPESVSASMGNVAHPNTECEDVVTAVLHYPDAYVRVSASLTAQGEPQSLRFYCENGMLSIPWKPAAAKARSNGYPEDAPELLAEIDQAFSSLPALTLENHAGQVRNFLLAILGKEPLNIDGMEGRTVIELITAIYHAALTGARVSLPLEKNDPLYTLEGKIKNLPHFHEKSVSLETTAAQQITFSKLSQ